ncbi:MAG: LuxR C-terminal-related transcriptional regulator [Deltaproteobacteria bacterium]|nr:LuxR C-terminal-related transcriptional regulator [Deltaproteobacteria bacterium]
MDTPSITTHTLPTCEPATLRLVLDVESFEGNRVATIVDKIRRITNGQAVLSSLSLQARRLELTGPRNALEVLRRAIDSGMLRSELGANVPTVQLTPGPRAVPKGVVTNRRSFVLLVDGDVGRGRRDAAWLGEADVEVCITSRASTALALLRHTALPFDAVVLRHDLPDGDGLGVLDQFPLADRECSVLVVDDHPNAERARKYRVRGAFGYTAPLPTSLQLIGHVHTTVVDSQSWRTCEISCDPDEPPPCYLDPRHGAERLKFILKLTAVECEVAYCMLIGLRDQHIAKRLEKSERTAKRHVGRILSKADIKNRASLWAVLHHDAQGSVPELTRDSPVRPALEPAPMNSPTQPMSPSWPPTPPSSAPMTMR